MSDITKVKEVVSSKEVVDSIERSTALLSGSIPRTAEIKLPSSDHLSVQLVPLSMVKRIEELKSDNDLFKNISWSLSGGLLGIVTTLAMDSVAVGSIDKATWVLIAALITGIALFTGLAIRVGSKLDKEKDALFKIEFEKEHV